jgi:hypothetical protein
MIRGDSGRLTRCRFDVDDRAICGHDIGDATHRNARDWAGERNLDGRRLN